MKRYLSLFFLTISFFINAQIQSPSQFLGYELGTQFTREADVINYFEYVAKNSAMVQYKTYGKTNERRLLTYAVISSEENIKNLEAIRKNNLKNAGILPGNAQPETAIVWLSYNVHGNEASSTEAAMNTLYKLITEKKDWLQNTVVIIDPCVNPDGRDRYVNWYNQVKATPYNINQDATEHHEPWPGGRPNHYLFDLNRDWLWTTQVESQQRIALYNRWMPHIHVDFHEQGINEPYYFAPAAEPFHEIITPWQREFQTQIGKNNAKYFDKNGWLYFTRERFDLLYPSYGDTYPTFMGAIGMTYEQAGHGRSGLGIKTDDGYVLTLKDRVAHHTTTGLSTVEMGHKNAKRINKEFNTFFHNHNFKYKSYILEGNTDKIQALTKLLDRHQIKYGFLSNKKVSGYDFLTQNNSTINVTNALVVSTNQPKGKMVKVMFEPNAKLTDPLTYDITSWSIPYAYGLETVASSSLVPAMDANPFSFKPNTLQQHIAGYIAKWNSLQDAAFLSDLLQNNIIVRFTEKDLQFNGKHFEKGSLVITQSDNKTNRDFNQTITKIANSHQRNLYASPTGFSDNRTDFGSPDIKMVNKQRIAVLKGKGVSSLSYGAIWHFFENQLKYPITSIDTDYFSSINLNNYDVIVLPEGFYQGSLNEYTFKKVKNWVQKGGKIIALGSAVQYFKNVEELSLTTNNSKEKTSQKEDYSQGTDNQDNSNDLLIPYDQRERNSIKDFITGSIYKISIDNTHPLAFGYDKTYYSLKLGNTSYSFLKKGYNVGYIKGDAVSVSGFSGKDAKEGLKNSLVFGEERLGKGSIIYLADNVLFRSFWENGKLFFVNALFFVNNNVFTL